VIQYSVPVKKTMPVRRPCVKARRSEVRSSDATSGASAIHANAG
jgi:hypothetical protein